MSPTPRHPYRHLFRVFKGAVAAVVISAALIVGTVALAMPWIQSHPDQVRGFLSQRLERDVSFARLTSQWRQQGPLFDLDQVELVDRAGGAEPFRIAHASLSIDFYAWLKSGVSMVEFRIDGVSLDVVRQKEGGWRIARLGQNGQEGGNADTILKLGAVILSGARVHLADEQSGREITLDRVDLRILNDDGKHRFGANLHLAENTPPISVACEIQAQQGQCYLTGKQLEPARWMGTKPWYGISALAGTVTAQAWLDWSPVGLQLRVESKAEDLILRGATPIHFSDGDLIEPRASIPVCRVAFVGARTENGDWSGDLMEWRNADDSGKASVAVHAQGNAAGDTWHVSAPTISLDAVAPLAALAAGLPEPLRLWLFESAPRGTIENLLAERDGRDLISAQVRGFGFRPGLKSPGIEVLDGELEGDADALLFRPRTGMSLQFDFPRVFRSPIVANWRAGTLSVVHADDGWRLEALGLDLAGPAFAVQGRTSVLFDNAGGRPMMDASLDLQASDISQAKMFWPVNVMPPKTVEWLDRALVTGRMPEAHAIIHGDLDDWPFHHQEGRFEAWARIEDTDLAYNPRWPMAKIDSAELDFVDDGMSVVISSGDVLKNRVTQAEARIEAFGDATLNLHVAGEGGGDRLLDVLRQSPLQQTLGKYLDDVHLGGRAKVDFDLTLPLREHDAEAKVDGRGELEGSDLSDGRHNLKFDGATGALRFSNHGFATDALTVNYRGELANLKLASGEFVRDRGNEFEATLWGNFAPATLFADALPASLSAALVGRSLWTAEVVSRPVAPAELKQGESKQSVTLISDLVGTAINLPAPLAKPASQSLPATVKFELPMTGARGSIVLADLMHADLKLPANGELLRAAIAFGGVAVPELPRSGMMVRGDVALLDLAGFGAMKGGEGGVTLDADLKAAQTEVLGRRFQSLQVKIATSAAETRLEIAGPEATGQITLPSADAASTGVKAQFAHLFLPEAPADGTSAGIATAAEPAVTTVVLDPAALPILHLKIDDLRLGKARLGATQLESHPIEHGLHVDSFTSRSPDLGLDAKGDWTLIEGRERSAFKISMSAESLGRMLDAFGYAGIVDGGPTSAEVNGEWPGSPALFSLAVIDGNLKASIGQGRVLEVDPGAGRLFGLFSLQALPRRLSLDFSDFFKSGLAFDKISANFELKHGDAYTADLSLKGPAADITVSGRAGLKQRDYDQEIVVTPRVGSVLPVVGALAGGPVGAAAGFVIGNVFPVGAGRARYRVTGAWEKPVVTLVAKEKIANKADIVSPAPN